MQTIKTVIIEDEKPAARKLERMLKNFPELENVAVLHSVEESSHFFRRHEAPDLIFSDIMLGDGLSFEIFDSIPLTSFLIFTTAFDQYTLKAFKLNSIDYLLKPINEDDLSAAIEKYKSFGRAGHNNNHFNYQELLRKQKPKLSRIVVKIGYNLKIVPVDEISCFYSENKIVYAQTMERSFPTDFTLEDLDENLYGDIFFRVNRQFIININCIKNIHTSPYFKVELLVQPQGEISVSRERVKDFKNWIAK